MGCEVRGIDVHHEMRGQKDWRSMIDHLVESVQEWNKMSSAPLIGLGHSFGGAMLCCAAGRRPDLFQKLVIVDPPMFHPLVRITWRTVQSLLGQRASQIHPLVLPSPHSLPCVVVSQRRRPLSCDTALQLRRTVKRRNGWASEEEASQ